ncbi:MAG: hypothetical protein ACRDTC_04140 [Pseudonocardiaceae bacterium]
MRDDVSLAERYPPLLRAALVNWAGASGPPGLPPPAVVEKHLAEVFRAAARSGKRMGILVGLLVWVPAVAAVAVALLLGPAT